MLRKGELSRVLAHLSHGGHALEDAGKKAGSVRSKEAPQVLLSEVVQASPELAAEVGSTRFDYLFRSPLPIKTAHLPAGSSVKTTVKALNALGDAMIEQDADLTDPRQNSPIPPIYTYWGQFIDHDLTANTDRDEVLRIDEPDPLQPVAPDDVVDQLRNLRNPALNLDSLYGDGPFAPTDDPEFVPYDGIKLRLGTLTPSPVGGALIPPVDDRHRDLPRVGASTDPAESNPSRALIGDGRNDENLVIAQLHVAFMRFHNAAVDWVRANEPERIGDGEVFLRARDLTRWTYQWLCIHDYLRTVTANGTVDRVLVDENDLLDLEHRGTYMPLEFSVAAFRFGHSMIRGSYDWNRNFGRPGNAGSANASFELLFTFTGKSPRPFFGTPTLPDNWPVEWDRMVDKNSLFSDRFARRIDTHLAPPLKTLSNEGNQAGLDQRVKDLLKQLARRNLLRGWLLSLPTGQAVADELGIPRLTAGEIEDSSPAVLKALRDGKMVDRTPLWFYLLKEAEVKADGASLGPAGSQIVAATIIGQVRHDPTSYLSQSSWTPSKGVRLPDGSPVRSIPDFLRFAGVL